MGGAQQRALRHPRDARAGQHRPHRVARLRAAHQLGCRAARGARQARDARTVPMTRIARTGRARLWPLAAIVAAFVAGAGVDAWLRTYGPPIPASVRGGTDKNERDDGTRGAGRPDRVPTVP